MRACILLLPLLATCGVDTFEADFALPVIRSVSVRASNGTVRIRSGPAGQAKVIVRGNAGRPLDQTVKVTDSGETLLVEVAEDVSAAIELDITAPGGAGLFAMCGDAAVDLGGKWGKVVVRTGKGGISARVDSVASGSLESHGGAIEFAASAAGPTGDFAAKSLVGDVAIRMPADWRGRLHLSTQSGQLDVPSQPNLRITWDEGAKSLLAFAGPAWTEEDRKREMEEKGSPTALWGSSASGTVSFRLGD